MSRGEDDVEDKIKRMVARLEQGGSTRKPSEALVRAFEEVKKREAEARAKGMPIETVADERRRRQEKERVQRRAAAEQARRVNEAEAVKRGKRVDDEDGGRRQATDEVNPLRAWLTHRSPADRPSTPGPRLEKKEDDC